MANPRVSDWYDRVVSSLDKCVFCDLKAKYIVAEESGMVLAVNLFPYVDGHLLIIPRRHIEKFCELTLDEWVAVRRLTLLGMDLLKRGFDTENSNVLYREGGVGSGKSLGHLHLHIMPCVPGFLARNEKGIFYTYQELKLASLEIAERLRALCREDTFDLDEGQSISKLGFMKRACLLCDKSTCGYKTGCVIAKNGKVLAEGWNATLPGEVYCQNGQCVRESGHFNGGKEPDKVCSIHAEAYAVAECAGKGVSIEGSELYVTTFPCIVCCRLLARSGISKVCYMSEYMGGRVGEAILLKNGINIEKIEESAVWKN
jgi:dCMP deaminase